MPDIQLAIERQFESNKKKYTESENNNSVCSCSTNKDLNLTTKTKLKTEKNCIFLQSSLVKPLLITPTEFKFYIQMRYVV